MRKTCLIVEGGGFKTGFTTGVLDAFLSCAYQPFNRYIGVSGGSIAVSYFLSKQYRSCLNAMRLLAKNEAFINFKRTFGEQGYMDIDYLATVAQEEVPFDLDQAIRSLEGVEARFVATNRETGSATYIKPDASNWIDALIASSTLPFVTKGKHYLNGVEYFDGGWSDPLPVKWAYDQGVRDILVIRTWPSGIRSSQSWADYFGSIYYSSSPGLKKSFTDCYKNYNNSLDFIAKPPKDLKIAEIAPKKLLKSGTYSYTSKTIMNDYRYGLDRGLLYANENK